MPPHFIPELPQTSLGQFRAGNGGEPEPSTPIEYETLLPSHNIPESAFDFK